MKRLILALLALALLAGCAGKQDCSELANGAAQLERAAKAFPAHAEVLNQCAQQATVSAYLCSVGQKVDTTVYERCMAAANKLADEALEGSKPPAPTQEASEPASSDPGGNAGLSDDIPASSVNWIGDLKNVPQWPWPAKYDLRVRIEGNNLIFDAPGTEKWASVNGLNCNFVVIANPDTTPKGGTWEWGRDNTIKRAKKDVYGDASHIKLFGAVSKDWQPKTGERVCFAKTALSRGKFEGRWTWEYNKVYERTAIRCITWK